VAAYFFVLLVYLWLIALNTKPTLTSIALLYSSPKTIFTMSNHLKFVLGIFALAWIGISIEAANKPTIIHPPPRPAGKVTAKRG